MSRPSVGMRVMTFGSVLAGERSSLWVQSGGSLQLSKLSSVKALTLVNFRYLKGLGFHKASKGVLMFNGG